MKRPVNDRKDNTSLYIVILHIKGSFQHWYEATHFNVNHQRVFCLDMLSVSQFYFCDVKYNDQKVKNGILKKKNIWK